MAVSGDASSPRAMEHHGVETRLSEDERRVLDLLSAGLPMHDVAQLLHLTEPVLHERFATLLRHYGAEDRTSLVASAYRRGETPGLARLARSVAVARCLRQP